MSSLEQSFFDRWLRRGIITSAAFGFTLPYFRLLNRIHATGDGILDTLPHKGVVFLSNHQTYFIEAIAFYHLVYIRHLFPTESPFLRFSAAEETMKKNLVTAEKGDLMLSFDTEAMNHSRSAGTEDHAEAAKAFVEKRAPVFTGR